MDIILEVTAFAFSVAAFVYGVLHILRKNAPNYFKLYVFAVGCYMLEELWFIVFFFLANSTYDGIVTVRLFGVFGCLCFMLSSNANEFDKLVDERNSWHKNANDNDSEYSVESGNCNCVHCHVHE